MSFIGYYKVKFNDYVVGTYSVNFYKNGFLSGTATITVKDFCDQKLLCKYIDKTGKYRFVAFNEFYELRDNPELIGKTDEFIYSIYTQSPQKNIGYRNERIVSCVNESVSNDDLLLIADLFTSPKIFLNFTGTNTDLPQDWVEVTIKNSDNIARRRKGQSAKLLIDFVLPETYQVTRL